jgi:hypothetical protein
MQNEACSIDVLKTIPLDVREWGTEAGYDRMTIGATAYSGASSPQGVTVQAGTSISWVTDGTVTGAGFTICVDPYVSCYPTPAPTQPTAAPTQLPTAAPTAAPTEVPTGGCFASGFFQVLQ